MVSRIQQMVDEHALEMMINRDIVAHLYREHAFELRQMGMPIIPPPTKAAQRLRARIFAGDSTAGNEAAEYLNEIAESQSGGQSQLWGNQFWRLVTSEQSRPVG